MRTVLLATIALLLTSPVRAQDAGDVRLLRDVDLQLDATQRTDLAQWTNAVRQYRTWYQRYRNRVSRNIFGFVTDRRPIPAVPAWLPGKCDLLSAFVPTPNGPLADACALLAYYRTDFTSDPAAQQAALLQRQNEQDPHSSFWKHVHLDAGWASLDYRTGAYGVVGVHVTLPEIAKRVQIFLPPGVLLVSVPDGRGGREFQPAATIGVSIKMFSFEFPQHKPGTAYFNVAKAYFINHSSPAGTNAAADLVGLSFSWGR